MTAHLKNHKLCYRTLNTSSYTIARNMNEDYRLDIQAQFLLYTYSKYAYVEIRATKYTCSYTAPLRGVNAL